MQSNILMLIRYIKVKLNDSTKEKWRNEWAFMEESRIDGLGRRQEANIKVIMDEWLYEYYNSADDAQTREKKL